MRRSGTASTSEAGYTLLEATVVVALAALLGSLGCAALADRPGQAASSAVAFAGLITEARSLAAVNGAASAGDSGASIGVERDGDTTVVTVYARRPIAGADAPPVAAANLPPLRLSTQLALVQDGVVHEAPFALFVSASSHLSAQPAFRFGAGTVLRAEPACPLRTGVLIRFMDGVHDQTHALSCEGAQLDLDASPAAARAAGEHR